MAIHITGDAHADQVLTDSPFALLVGMMLDQLVLNHLLNWAVCASLRSLTVDRRLSVPLRESGKLALYVRYFAQSYELLQSRWADRRAGLGLSE